MEKNFTTNLHLLKALEGLFENADWAFSEIAKAFPNEVACSKGCSDCCHAMFDVSLIEAILLKKEFLALPRKVRRDVERNSKRALKEFRAVSNTKDPSTVKIRCPLLSKQDSCLIYKARPINCRTYGVPTNIDGKAHVCPNSRFELGKNYTTLNLGPLQARLLELSMSAGGPVLGRRRWSIAEVILDLDEVFASL
ncbi:hypothetical protein DBT_0316 [Dissulfuribacter thermophilus]|uniref:YkgJ family cysteine cluster protein n=1 Tax=Dissulfuribacter thermophilus TaxID=1156395 RepID=A0A1B9F9A4_9BACT|nr:YkgJ family cysteine cluster protein [Dissulfuribacter thermophilus]OCC16499.1 hypothetical protein DBT_0316 [Dissulfuribacter thermophilus]